MNTMAGLSPFLAAGVFAFLCFASFGDTQALVQGNTAFGVDLYRELSGTEGNLFFSPYSISVALGMTYGGARGVTETEMARVLCLPPGREAPHEAFAQLQAHLAGIQEKGEIALNVANSLWAQEGHVFLDEFFALMNTHYGAGLRFVDFATRTEEARKAINAWVEEETREKIRDLVKEGMLSPATTLVLCNAIYFKGDWLRPFDSRFTVEAPFHVGPDKTVQAPMMNQTTEAKVHAFEGFSALELPYAGNDLSMVVLLPEARDGLAALEARLTADALAEWLETLSYARPGEVMLGLPKFKATSEFELSSVLAGMGMPSAFTNADFSGMTGRRDLFIGKVAHKAFVEVNEEGTEAAAATAVIMDKAMSLPVTFLADHPFLFLIRENTTGSLLFLGRIVDPTTQ